MKLFIFIFFSLLSISIYGQNKYNHLHFEKLTNIEGTEYVVASIENRGKMFKTNEKYLLFVNTLNGETTHIDLGSGANIRSFNQIKIDSLAINLIILSAKTVDLNGKKGIDWDDPIQIIILSTDGKEKRQLTDDNFFARTWVVNKETGRIIINGHYDTNDNGKYDNKDESEILIYDLKTFELITKASPL